eukprot:6183884-Pleurochrysis_carterae.AAC.3
MIDLGHSFIGTYACVVEPIFGRVSFSSRTSTGIISRHSLARELRNLLVACSVGGPHMGKSACAYALATTATSLEANNVTWPPHKA